LFLRREMWRVAITTHLMDMAKDGLYQKHGFYHILGLDNKRSSS